MDAVAVDDLDDDGWLDVIGGSSTCCAACLETALFVRTGPRTFAVRNDLLDDAPPGTGVAVMGVTLGGERMLLAMGNQCGNQDAPGFYRLRARDAQGYPHYAPFDPLPLDAVFRAMSPEMKRRRR